MRRILLALAVLLTARAASAQGMKIGYVDVQRAVREVEEGKALQSRMKKDLDERRAQIDQKKASLEKMKADFEKQAPVLSDEAKKKKAEEFQKAVAEFQASAQEAEGELQGREQDGLQSISKRLLQVVAEVSEKEQFSFVLDKAALLYAPAASDVTNEVVRRYNERFGAGTAGAASQKAQGKAPAGNNKAPPAKK